MDAQKVDKKEFDLPETLFVRDIENRVIQGIILQCLSKIDGISLVEGNFIDQFLGRDSLEGIKGIHAEQDNKKQCVSIRIEVSVCYGVLIPEKAEEIQTEVTKEVTRLTGLHVSCVHVVFRSIVPENQMKRISDIISSHASIASSTNATASSETEEEYNDIF